MREFVKMIVVMSAHIVLTCATAPHRMQQNTGTWVCERSVWIVWMMTAYLSVLTRHSRNGDLDVRASGWDRTDGDHTSECSHKVLQKRGRGCASGRFGSY